MNTQSSNVNQHLQQPTGDVVLRFSQIDQSLKQIEVEEELECKGLFYKSDSILLRIVKIIIIVPLSIIYLLWKFLRLLFTPLIIIYHKYIEKCLIYSYLKTILLCTICCQQIPIYCKKFCDYLNRICQKFCECIECVCEQICNFFSCVCETIYNCICWVCQKLWIPIVALYECSAYLLNLYANLAFTLFMKAAEIRGIIQIAFSVLTIPITFYLVVPIFDCITYKLIIPFVIKIKTTTKILILAFHIHIIIPFFEIFVLNFFNLLCYIFIDLLIYFIFKNFVKGIILLGEYFYKYILVNFYKYVIVKFLWELVILNFIKFCEYLANKITTTAKIAILAFYIHILIPFQKIYVMSFYTLLKFIVVNFYLYIIVKFLYQFILVSFYKLFKFLFYYIIYKILLVNLSKMFKWFGKKVFTVLKFIWKDAQWVAEKICLFFTWLMVDMFYKRVLLTIYKYIIRPFFKYPYLLIKYVSIYSYRYCIKPFFEVLWYICKAFGRFMKFISSLIIRFLRPIWRFLCRWYQSIKKVISSLWAFLKRIGEKKQHNQ